MKKEIFLSVALLGWPMFHGDTARTGFSESKVPSQPNVLWQSTAGGNWPVIDGDKVFFANEEQVFAVSLKSGEILWQYRDQNNPNFFPRGSAVADGRVFVTVNDSGLIKNMGTGFIYALNAENGQFLWRQQIADAPSHSLPLVIKEKVFIGDDSGTLNALDATTGKILWQKKLVGDGEIHSSPAYADGLIFIGTEGDARYHEHPPHPSSMFALKPSSGEVVWQFPIDYTQGGTNLIHATPAISDGVVYFGSENGYFYALKTSDGQLVWKKQIAVGGMMVGTSSAAGLGDSKVFVGLWSGKFLALNQKTGETVWEFSYEGKGTDSSPVVADGKVCLGAHEGYFYCLDAETGKVLWQENFGGSSAALANGVLIVINADGDLVALSDESQAALDLPAAKTSGSKLYLVMILTGTGILLALGGLWLQQSGEQKR